MTTTGNTSSEGKLHVMVLEVSAPSLMASLRKGRWRGSAVYRREIDGGGPVEMLALGKVRDYVEELEGGASMRAAYEAFRRELRSQPDEAIDELKLVGWTAFAPNYSSPSWRGFERKTLFIPEVLVRKNEESTTAVVCAAEQEAEEVWSRWQSVVEAPGETKPPRSDSPGIDDEVGQRDDGRQEVVTWLDDRRFRDGVARFARGDFGEDRKLKKVVLARRALIEAKEPIDEKAMLQTLGQNYPGCVLFAIAPAENSALFVGATPERLASVEGQKLSTMALAGTTRGSQKSPEKRRKAEEALNNSAKDREEHRYVVEMIADRLRSLSLCVEVGSTPVVRRLANVSHLETPVEATLKKGRSIADAVDALHPTPAVCGTPRQEARELIEEQEGFDRGLYAGAFGWIDVAGDGVFDVALRCGLVEGRRALSYAGAGITSESDPQVEWAETEKKFRAFLEAIVEGEQ